MVKIQPRKIEAVSTNQCTFEFLRVKDNTSLAYTFTFCEKPRAITDYDKEFCFDIQDDPAQLWLIPWALLSFDKARELGVMDGKNRFAE